MCDVVALESADDEHGFSWWLAVVTRAPFQHKGKTQTTAAGVKLIEKVGTSPFNTTSERHHLL
jgi:hypothetical protein